MFKVADEQGMQLSIVSACKNRVPVKHLAKGNFHEKRTTPFKSGMQYDFDR